MWHRIETLRALPAAERAVTWRAHGWLLAMWVAVKLIPFHRLSARVAAIRRRPSADPTLGTCVVRRSMGRASRTFPFAGCLPQALAAEVLLRELGHEAERHIGVERSATAATTAPDDARRQPLRAHAWVTSYGDVIVGGDDAPARYRPLTAAGTPTLAAGPTGARSREGPGGGR